MKATLTIVGVVLAVLIVGGLLVSAIANQRQAAARMSCTANLKQLGIALHTHNDCHGHLPIGTVQGTTLPVEKRLSWIVQIYPTYVEGGVKSWIEHDKSWDDPANYPPRESYPKAEDLRGIYNVGSVKKTIFLCPATPVPVKDDRPFPTHYLGVTGAGLASAELPLSHPRAGVFGHDRKVALDDIKDGQANTLAVAEASNGGPWTAGGRATLRPVDPNGEPCVGAQGQFPSGHFVYRSLWSSQPVSQFLLADGSIRTLTASVSPRVLADLATIRGGEEVSGILD